MKFAVTSPYGSLEEVRGLIPHTGVDLGMPEGTPLRSVFNGTIEQVWDNAGKIGNGVKIKTDDGLHTIYGHMSKVDVHVGDKVHAGDLVGFSGNTGNSTGPHLHFGMQDQNGTFIDPTKFVDHVSNASSGTDIVSNDTVLGHLFKFTTPLGDHITGTIKDRLREQAAHKTIQIAMGIFDGLSDILVETIGAISLVGCTVLIIMRIAGYDKGFKQAGMLFVLNILVKLTLGR